MNLIRFKPTTPGLRHQIRIQKNLLARDNRLVRSDIIKLKQCYGRCQKTGHITVRHKGGGCKKLYRNIDFSNEAKHSIVVTTMYDPYRTAFVTLNFDLERKKFFRSLAVNNVPPGAIQICNETLPDLKLGYRTCVKNIPTGSYISSLSLNRNSRIQYIRSAGTSGQLLQCDEKTARIKLPSNKVVELSSQAWATLGVVSNLQHNLTQLGKAGRARHLGIRPTVRGIAMNPVDHPHGGRTNGGRPSVSPWGLPCKDGFSLSKRSKTKKSKLKYV